MSKKYCTSDHNIYIVDDYLTDCVEQSLFWGYIFSPIQEISTIYGTR
jgi:hypothetical protein